MTNRREFLLTAMPFALCGCGGARMLFEHRRNNAALKAAMDEYVRKELFGGIACASNRGDLVCVGNRTLTPSDGPVTVESMFDLASVGKTQTASLCALLYAEGKLDVDAPFTEYLTEHVLAKENCRITVRDLATHSGGFDNSKPYMVKDPARQFAALNAKRPKWERGKKFCYACSNFVYLGFIVEKLTGMDLDAAAKKMLWGPLGMTHTTWNTIVGNPNAVEYCRATYYNPSVPLRQIGEHNDACAHLAPRPMGNGSCFSNVTDMQLFVEDMLHRERFPAAYYDLLFTPSFSDDGYRRSFGWDMSAKHSTFCDWAKTGFSDAAICHTGWTGPAIVVDPKRDFAGVVLASQLAGKNRTMGPRMQLMELMASNHQSLTTNH